MSGLLLFHPSAGHRQRRYQGEGEWNRARETPAPHGGDKASQSRRTSAAGPRTFLPRAPLRAMPDIGEMQEGKCWGRMKRMKGT